MLTTQQKLLCALCHLGVFIGIPFVAPLIVYLVSNDYFVKQQAKEALGFQIGMSILGLIGGVLSFVLIGIPILLAVAIAVIVLPILATIKIADGKDYSYPITGSFVRRNF